MFTGDPCARRERQLTTSRKALARPTQELVQLQQLARAGITAAFLAPPQLVENGPVLCPFRRATGVSCPSCGLTRSWTAVAHGRFADGFRFHPLGPPAFVGAALLSLAPRRWLERIPPYPEQVIPAFVTLWIAVWLIRLVLGGSREPAAD